MARRFGPILHVFNSTLVSGPETLVLPNLAGSGLDIRVVLLQETRNSVGAQTVASYATNLGFEVHEIPTRGRMDVFACFTLSRLLGQLAPSIIHTHGPKAGLYALAAARLGRCPGALITTHHGVRANDTSNKLKLFETVYEKLIIPRQARCLAVCSSDAQLLKTRGVPSSRLATHLNGTDRPLLTGTAKTQARTLARANWAQALTRPSFDESEMLWGVVGRLAPEKRHSILLESLAVLLKAQPGAKLHVLLFGSGPLETKLKTQASQLGLGQHVHFMGYRPDVSAEMAGLDLLLSLSSAEGLPINLIEAGWAAVPVAATAVDGVKDLIVHGESGWLLPAEITSTELAATLGGILQNPAPATDWATRLQSRVAERFSRKAWLEDLRGHYDLLRNSTAERPSLSQL